MLNRLEKAFDNKIERAENYYDMATKERNPCRREDALYAAELCGQAHAIQVIIHKEWDLADDVTRAERWHDLICKIRDLWEEL